MNARQEEGPRGGDPALSVIICTRDRCELLQRTLEFLSRQTLADREVFEIVVVDNGSRDQTRLVVETFKEKASIPLRYLFVEKPGLARARNTGLASSCGEIVVFTDDDMIFPEDWLERIRNRFRERPAPACVTGPVDIHPDSHPALRPPGTAGRKDFHYPAEPGEVGRGNNMAFARMFLAKVGPFDHRLGAGTACGSAEDTDMFYRVLKAGGIISYLPELKVYHDHHRHEPAAIRKICRNYAVGGTAYLVKHAAGLDVFAWKLLYWRFLGLRAAVKRAPRDDPFDPPMREVKKIYMRGFFVGLVRGFLNLFTRAR